MPPAIYLAALSRYHSYLNSSKQLLQEYDGKEPFASYLKKSFSANKKYGSKDRKEISHLCYCYFRLGKAAMSLSIEERILTALFLCSDQPNQILSVIKPEWNEKIHLPLHEKLLIINYSPKVTRVSIGESLGTLLITNVFPWKNELTHGIDHEKFCESFLIQPDLFLRIRPGKKDIVFKKLEMSGCGFRIIGENSIAIPNSTRVESILEPDREVVIQDYNSQETGRFISYVLSSIPDDRPVVWDCCAGSGGKSILAYDINPTIQLSVSDVRESILINLKNRFTKAGIRNYKSLTIDLVSDKSKIIICDAPCTGSGTWSRTPEQLYFFKENEIEKFASLQRKIVSNVIPQLQHGGSLIYITCSVFKKENEEVVEFIKENFHLQIKEMEVLKGYDKKADSMFVAVLKKPNH